jgi:external thioesterase TEII
MEKPQLFIIPFAGGNVYSFNFLVPYLEKFKITVLELPGRGKRIKENLLTEFDEAAEDIYKQILSKLTSSFFMIYGHSLGTGLGLRVANMLQKVNRAPVHLIFSGNPGPGVKEKSQWYLLEKSAFIDKIKKLGGLSEDLYLNDEFMEYIDPVFRADFELAERNTLCEEPVVSIPIYAIMGDLEKNNIHLSNWKRFTNAGFQKEVFTGDHFFIYKHPQRIAMILQQCFENSRLLKQVE